MAASRNWSFCLDVLRSGGVLVICGATAIQGAFMTEKQISPSNRLELLGFTKGTQVTLAGAKDQCHCSRCR